MVSILLLGCPAVENVHLTTCAYIAAFCTYSAVQQVICKIALLVYCTHLLHHENIGIANDCIDRLLFLICCSYHFLEKVNVAGFLCFTDLASITFVQYCIDQKSMCKHSLIYSCIGLLIFGGCDFMRLVSCIHMHSCAGCNQDH